MKGDELDYREINQIKDAGHDDENTFVLSRLTSLHVMLMMNLLMRRQNL
jgi:hypothetical protein